MNIVYILDSFPSSSEYFILNEIVELRKAGFVINILAFKKDSNAEKDRNYDDVIYDGPFFSVSKIKAHFYSFFHLKNRYFKTLLNQLFFSEFGFIKLLKNIKHFSTSVYYVYRLRDTPVNHLHAHFLFGTSNIAKIMSLLLDTPFSLSAHARDIYTINKEEIVEKLAYAKFTITCTASNKRFLENVTSNKINGEIFHIYHGINLSNWTKRSITFHSKKKKDVHILTVARLVEKKGLIFLIEAVEILKQQGLNLKCSIIGDGPMKDVLSKYIIEHNLTDCICMYGNLPQKEIKHFYTNADVFVLPCIVASDGDRDGIPNVLFEALAVGIPVISTSVSAVPELIIDSYTGLIVTEKNPTAIADSILKLKNDVVLYNTIIKKGWEKAEEFNIEKSTTQICKLYKTHVQQKN